MERSTSGGPVHSSSSSSSAMVWARDTERRRREGWREGGKEERGRERGRERSRKMGRKIHVRETRIAMATGTMASKVVNKHYARSKCGNPPS